jgi:hypothetical protein
VFTNCAPGREEAFARWYDEVHIGDLLRVPGMIRASRSTLSPAQATMETGEIELCGPERIGARFRYLAVYEFEASDPKTVLGEVQTRANTPEMLISPDLGEVYTVLYQDS